MKVEKMVGDVLESWSGYFDYTQKLQNWVFFYALGCQKVCPEKTKW